MKESTKQKSFVNVTGEEIYLFLALVLAMPYAKKQVLYEYWSVDEIVDTLLFRKYMTRLEKYFDFCTLRIMTM